MTEKRRDKKERLLRKEEALRTKEEQIEENNKNLISNISANMTLSVCYQWQSCQ